MNPKGYQGKRGEIKLYPNDISRFFWIEAERRKDRPAEGGAAAATAGPLAAGCDLRGAAPGATRSPEK
ncbi:MAG: hypothetical protein HQK81_15410 [Desulfovibrionaceae bacterium]|nr:hypothetical protein [Desulfovibrionaceae bacterium]